MLHQRGLSNLEMGYYVATLWLGSGIGTVLTLFKPVSLAMSSRVGFAAVAVTFFGLIFLTSPLLLAALGFGLSLTEIPAMNEAGRAGSRGVFSYYGSLSLATLSSSIAMPFFLYLGPGVALASLAVMSLAAAPMGKGNSTRRGLTFNHLQVFKQKYVALFFYNFGLYMAFDFIFTFFGARLMDLGYPGWASQAAFLGLFLTAFLVRFLHPISIMDSRVLTITALIFMPFLLLPMPVPLFSLAALGISYGFLPVMVALKVARSAGEDFATLNVMVFSSSGFASFLAPLIGGWAISLIGFEPSLLFFSALCAPMAFSGMKGGELAF